MKKERLFTPGPTMVPESVLLEFYASGELIPTVRAYRDQGLWAQITTHSQTSQYGQEITSRLSAEEEAQTLARYEQMIEHIRSGDFAREWKAEQEAGYPKFKQVRNENLEHPMIEAERELYRKLGRIDP